MRIGNMSVIEYLKQNVKYIRVRFLNLIKKKNTVWISAHLFTELSAFVITNISRRRSNQFGHTVFLHIFRHIHTDHCLFTAKHRFCQRFGKFCLTDTRWAEEQKRTNRTMWVFQTYSSSLNCLRNSFHRLILTDHTFVKFFFKCSKAFCLPIGQFLNRNLCPV